MCFLLGSMVACLLVPCTTRDCSRDMVHYNCLNSLTAGLKQTTAFYMIAHLYHDLYHGVLGWLCGLASELEWASLFEGCGYQNSRPFCKIMGGHSYA
jgi:hypothetical protein